MPLNNKYKISGEFMCVREFLKIFIYSLAVRGEFAGGQV
jgi:hypothetical protein